MPRSNHRSDQPAEGPRDAEGSASRLADAFGRTAKILQRTLDDSLSEHSRSTPRARALEVVVAAAQPVRLADIMAQVGISQATASGLVDGLVGDGLVRRAPDPSDGRARRLVATDAGVATAAAWREAYVQVVEAIFGVLPMEDRQSLARMLGRLTDSALAVSGPGDAGG